jgi:hypothetical protein
MSVTRRFISSGKGRRRSDPETAVKRGQRRGHRGGRVSLDEDEIRAALDQHGIEGFEQPRRDLVGRLAGPHDVEVHVRAKMKEVEYGIEHLTMLGRGAEVHAEARRAFPQALDDRRQLDCLGSSTRHDEDVHAGGPGGADLVRQTLHALLPSKTAR